MFILRISMIACVGTSLIAADQQPLRDDSLNSGRLVGEALIGTSGFEAGIAGEFRYKDPSLWEIRPEVFVNDDSRVGAAVSIGWDLGNVVKLPDDQDCFIGPRLCYHNADHYKWELGLSAIYSFPLFPDQGNHHHLEIIGTAGYVEHRDDDDSSSNRFGGTLGLAYAFQF